MRGWSSETEGLRKSLGSRKLPRRRLNIYLGGCLLLVICLAAAASWWGLTLDPNVMNIRERLLPPSRSHWLGTDHFGRDVFARIAYGSRIALLVGAGSTLLAASIGVSLGAWAGYNGGWWDEVIMRLVDGLMAFPGILLAIMLVTVMGPGLANTIFAIGIANVPIFARITRGVFLTGRNALYVEAARALGARTWDIIRYHILPNGIGPILVQATVTFSTAILTEASLSYLGLGIQPPDASWGRMLKEAQPQMGRALWSVLAPGAAIFLAVMALNLMGDGIRDRLDPETH
ncbi:MAG: ABC transporter permease [Firmicutes bacterium]|nr:ABC transporter permease [Bacillota bacterium]